MKPTDTMSSRTRWTVEPPLPPKPPQIPPVVLAWQPVLESFYAGIRNVCASEDEEARTAIMGWLRIELDLRNKRADARLTALAAPLRSALVEFDKLPSDGQHALQIALDGREIPQPEPADFREKTPESEALREHARRNRVLGQ